ncbi:MAG: GntR family transcriptional regulator, partial [Chloroflexota bacterium]|nr:GntR family transcriptional regulator [Chloroflexota bacterium]
MHEARRPTNGTADGKIAHDVSASSLPLKGAAELPSQSDRPTIKDEIYAALRERIVFGEIGPGQRLVETDLAARFGGSKTTVREALLILEAEGLVTLRPHRGGVVSPFSVDEYRDLQFVRDVLEFNRRRVELIRQGDADGLIQMVKGRHAEAQQMMPALFGEAGYRTDDGGRGHTGPRRMRAAYSKVRYRDMPGGESQMTAR